MKLFMKVGLMLIPLFWKIIKLLCMWIMKIKFYMIAILFNLIMILHVIIMREENMVVENLHVTKLPLVMLRLLLFLSSSLHMLDISSLDDLFAYKILTHRNYVRLKYVCHMLYDALFVLQFLSFM